MLILFLKLHHRGERGRKGRECKFPKIAHRTFDPINSWPPVVEVVVVVVVQGDKSGLRLYFVDFDLGIPPWCSLA